MQSVEQFPYDVSEDPHVLIPLQDGRNLSARIWRPQGIGPAPVILEYLPYRKRDGTAARDALNHPWLAGHGYVAARVDIAGTGESEGLFDDEYSEQELTDGVEVINWLAAQDWCSGAVGMTGISWGGFNGLQLAARAPEALKAVVSICSTVDRYADDIHYKGGCLLGENAGWASTVAGWFGLPPDPEIQGDAWRDIWLKRLEETPFLGAEWLRHQTRDGYWKHGSICEDYSAIKAAVLAVGGWHDGYRNTISRLVEGLDAPVKGIVGPWDHHYPHFAKPEPAIGFLQEVKRWYDRWLKDEPNGAEADPAYRAYVMDGIPPATDYLDRPGRWIAEENWPARTYATRRLYLTTKGLFEQEAPCEAEAAADLLCGMGAGEYFAFGFGPGELPDDQRGDDMHSLALSGLPVEAALDVVGAPRLTVTLAADQPKAQIAVRLSDLAPDGSATLITHGFLNLRQRFGPEAMVEVTPDEAFEVEIELDQCAYRLPAGHAFRLSVSSSYWPFIWPEPDLTRLTVYGGELSIPLRPLAQGDECAFEPPEAASPLPTRTISEGTESKDVSADPVTGETLIRIKSDNGKTEDLNTGLITSIYRGETWRITPDDPLSARSDFDWSRTMARGDWAVKVDSTLSQWADAHHFHIEATLTAFEGAEKVFAKTFSEKIPRV